MAGPRRKIVERLMPDSRLSLLLQTLARIAVSVELAPTLQILLDSLSELVRFDAGGIFVREADAHAVRARAVCGFPPDLHRPETEGIVGMVMRTGTPRLVHDVQEDFAYVSVRPQTRSQLTVPLSSPRGILGAVSLEADRTNAFTEDDLALTSLFAQQATIVIERALLHEQLIRRSRIDREIEIAREILEGLTPSSVPEFQGLQVAGKSLMAESVGGDAFDFISYPDAQLGLSISDAKGKGLPAALLAVAHQSMLHALVSVDLRLRATFSRISALLSRSVPFGNFITTFYGILDVPEKRMVYINAGHPPPLIVRASGAIEPVAVTGAALGFPQAAPLREAYAVFGQGDGLVLFTDGVTEVGPSPDEFFDVEGVEATVRQLWSRDAAAICDGLLDAVVQRASGSLPDDATVVVAKFTE
jgi:sigma-B regulation protein RsbU (phosphoserine phosphatase)